MANSYNDRQALHHIRAPHDYRRDLEHARKLRQRAEFLDRLARATLILAALVLAAIWLVGK